MRNLATIADLECPCLSMDVQKNGDCFAFGLQDGRVYVVSYKIDELLGDFEGYQESYTLDKAKDFIEEKEKEKELEKEKEKEHHVVMQQHHA